MITATENEKQPLADFASTPPSGDAPKWLADARAAAAASFDEQGLPTTRHEHWRYTRLRPLEQNTFLPARAVTADVSATDLAAFGYEGLAGPTLVFVNGRYDAGLSETGGLPEGVVAMTLAEAMTKHADVVEANLAKLAACDDAPFVALNTAQFEDGLFVHVADGVKCETPIRVLSVTATAEPVVTSARALVVAGADSAVTVIEDYEHLGGALYLTNAVTEIVVGAGADVHHYMIELESDEAVNVSTLKVRQEERSRFASHSVLFGGAIVRNDVNPVLAGEYCHSLLNGLYVGADRQHHDNYMRVDHTMPNCDSRQYYKGVMSGSAQGVFAGRIVVAKDAQKTDAIQNNQNMLLSDAAQAQTMPQLEIYADDVRCTHGATIGELDDDAIFYLQSRGISAEAARTMLVYSFAEESLERMELAPIRDRLAKMLLDRLPETELLRKLV